MYSCVSYPDVPSRRKTVITVDCLFSEKCVCDDDNATLIIVDTCQNRFSGKRTAIEGAGGEGGGEQELSRKCYTEEVTVLDGWLHELRLKAFYYQACGQKRT